jgi:pyridoxamine 5'-phosphate oxidase
MQTRPWSEPFVRFNALYEEVKRVVPRDPNALSLATVDAKGVPSVRVVLMKDFTEAGLVFYTNYESTKGKALLATKVASLNFYWPEVQQQVRLEGTVETVSPAEADAYFATRPRVSQLGAWTSQQSQPLESREALEQRLDEVTATYEGREVPRPPHWGGFRVVPQRIEFWKAHQYRLHWREEYVRTSEGWEWSWLNP